MTREITQSAQDLAAEWLEGWVLAIERQDAPAAAGMFAEEGYWRDILSFTWDLRTFHGTARITSALTKFMVLR